MKLEQLALYDEVEDLEEFWDELGLPKDAWQAATVCGLVYMFGAGLCREAMLACSSRYNSNNYFGPADQFFQYWAFSCWVNGWGKSQGQPHGRPLAIKANVEHAFVEPPTEMRPMMVRPPGCEPSEIDRLATFIMARFPYEPGRTGKSESAVDVAIRVMSSMLEIDFSGMSESKMEDR